MGFGFRDWGYPSYGAALIYRVMVCRNAVAVRKDKHQSTPSPSPIDPRALSVYGGKVMTLLKQHRNLATLYLTFV